MKHETKQITQTVKQLLKSQGKRYSDLASHLDVSLASVKRILNSEDIQISRLTQISSFLDIDFFELIEKSKSSNQQVYTFSKEQEIFLSKDFNNFLILRMLVMHKPIEDIQNTLTLTDIKVSNILSQLEKLKLIERHPNNTIKNRIPYPVKWIEGGQLEKSYNKQIVDKLSSQIHHVGINRKCTTTNSTHINIKELLLKENESLDLKNKMLELTKSYDMLTKLRLKSPKDFEVVSIATIVGSFSWWE